MRFRPSSRRGIPMLLCLAIAGISEGVTPVIMAEESREDFFERKVRPLLIQHCYECHGEDEVKGGLRLNSRAGWQSGGDSGPALVPHQPEQSLLIKAIGYKDRDLKMPPKGRLSDSDMAVLLQWVAEGAYDPREGMLASDSSSADEQKKLTLEKGREFWSFKLPVKTAAPKVTHAQWPKDEVDHFILARLEQNNLSPAPAANKHTLVRRLYYDLVGLPPSLQDWQSFAALEQKHGSKAIEMLVDQLMDSPQFAERWGRHWLDLARFAESSGGGRTLPFKDAWRYRDYVIQSIHEDVPLNQFITEQISGDLMPHEDITQRQRQLTATGFLALGPTNYEEQDKGVLRMDIIDEQLETIGRGFLGMTLSCARCHDHKFDPISAQDYYAMAGILRSTRTLKNYTDNVARWIDVPLPQEGAVEQKLLAHEVQLASLEKDLATANKELKRLQPKSKSKDQKAVALDELPGLVVDETTARPVGPWKLSRVSTGYVHEGYFTDINENKGATTLTYAPAITQAGMYEVRLAYHEGPDRATNVPILIQHADGEENITVNQRKEPPLNERFVSLGRYRFENNDSGFVLLSNADTDGFVTADAVVFVPVEEADKDAPAPAAASATKNPELATAKQQVADLKKVIKELQQGGPVRPEVMSVRDEDTGKISDSPLHIRGSIRNLGATVPRGFLQVAMHEATPDFSEKESGRRELAAWLTSDKNPLTARVLVNRVWMILFDEGLVRTVDNFGVMGETPSHPELLDALAVDFMQDEWSLKQLVKRLVLTSSYQMASAAEMTPANIQAGQQKDPDNRLLWKQNRKRLNAEAIRDTMLTLSGALDDRLYGQNMMADSVDANSGLAQNLEYNFVFKDTRRSIYTPAFRNRRLELFEAFDFADINQPIARRHTSAVAPQALYMMNHPFVMEQSTQAAERWMEQAAAAADSEQTAVSNAYRSALGRDPTEKEMQIAIEFLTSSSSESGAELLIEKISSEDAALFWQTLFASLDFRHLN